MPVVIPDTVVSGAAINVHDLLAARNKIPPYQRDFVWSEKQVAQLWDDLVEHHGRSTAKANEEINLSPKGYFLGAMVVIAPKTTSDPLEVADGQQRLTSLSAVASVLYDAISAWPSSNPAKSGLEQRLLQMLGRYDSGWVPNLELPDAQLQNFFLGTCLLNRSKADKVAFWATAPYQTQLARKASPYSRLRRALEIGYDKLDKFLAAQPDPALAIKRLESFILIVTEAVVGLRITAMSYTSAYAIFESLNNRGIPLSQADLIKSELLKEAGTNFEKVADNWIEARQTVESIEGFTLPDFIHYSYLSRTGAVKARELYDCIKAAITSSAAALSYSEELVADAAALEAVIDKFDSSWSPVTLFMLKDIRHVLNIKLCYPYLIAAHRAHGSSKVDFEAHVQAVMNFAYRFMKVMDGTVESLASVITDACTLIRGGKPIADIKSLFAKHASDAEFIKEFEDASFPNAKLGYFTVYYLEKAQLGGTLPAFHGVEQNLEHIMPSTPSAAEWGPALACKSTAPEIYKDYLWRAGNLLPLTAAINKSIKNKGIMYKLKNATAKDYESGGHTLVSPQTVRKFLTAPDQWDYASIEARQKWLASNVAVKAWPLV